MKVLFLGDVHGKFKKMATVIEGIESPILQVGDFGAGFRTKYTPHIPNDMWILRGNHDNPAWFEGSHRIKKYDYGFPKYWGARIGWLAGGFSTDADSRTPFVDWWPDEQIAYEELSGIIDLFTKDPVDVLITHEPPAWVKNNLGLQGSRTSDAIQAILDNSKTIKLHVFGHVHLNFRWERNEVIFKSLAELELWPCELSDYGPTGLKKEE